MSYISDYEKSEQTEEDYRTYRSAEQRENARERWEQEQDDLEIDYDEDDY